MLPRPKKVSMDVENPALELSPADKKGKKKKAKKGAARRRSHNSSSISITRGSLHRIKALPSGSHLRSSKYALLSQTDIHGTHEIERLVFRTINERGEMVPTDLEGALETIPFGPFHIYLVIASGMVFMSCSSSMTALSFILPGATCDLQISAFDKGVINLTPYAGMILGTFFWGVMSDKKGRRITLLMALGVDIGAALVSSLCTNKWALMVVRSINGFGIIGPLSLVFAYVGEFLTEERRDRVLSFLEFFWVFGMIYIPAIAWLTLTSNIRLGPTSNVIYFHSWNLLAICSAIPSAISFVLLYFLPESPKYTLLKGDLVLTHQILRTMFVMNKRGHSFRVHMLLETPAVAFFKDKELNFWQTFKDEFAEIYNNYKALIRGKLKWRLFNVAGIDFFFNFSYLTLIIWIPELLERNAASSHARIPGMPLEPLCHSAEGGHDACVAISTTVFQHTLIITLSCLPVLIVLFFLVRYVPKNILIGTLLLLSGIPTIFYNHVLGEDLILVCSCIFESMASYVETLLFVSAVGIFPTNLLGTALAMTVCFGRAAAILGSVYIGTMLDTHCEIAIYTFGGSLVVSAALGYLLPK